MKKYGKRKSAKYKKELKQMKLNDKKKEVEYENEENNKEKSNKNKQPKYPRKPYNKKNKNKKKKKKSENDSIIKASKESSHYIEEILDFDKNNNQNNKENDKTEENKKNEDDIKVNNNTIEEKKEYNEEEEEEVENNNNDNTDINNDNNNTDNNNTGNKIDEDKNKKLDDIFLSSLYDLFDEYDEILIKRDENKQYIINAYIKIEEDKEIRFEIIFDKEREYFDYYPNNKNFDFKGEDDPFNYDLDIPKTDFCLLVRNFKKYKNK